MKAPGTVRISDCISPSVYYNDARGRNGRGRLRRAAGHDCWWPFSLRGVSVRGQLRLGLLPNKVVAPNLCSSAVWADSSVSWLVEEVDRTCQVEHGSSGEPLCEERRLWTE